MDGDLFVQEVMNTAKQDSHSVLQMTPHILNLTTMTTTIGDGTEHSLLQIKKVSSYCMHVEPQQANKCELCMLMMLTYLAKT
jgi:hypothetical protein